MGIGTSKGAYYDDEAHFWSEHDVKPPSSDQDGDYGMVLTPRQLQRDKTKRNQEKEMDTIEEREFGTPINYKADEPSNALNFNTRPDVFEKNIHEFDNWLDFNSQKMGRDLRKDFQNYDLTGYWLKNGNVELGPGEHLTDEFKKPNHPTFSSESKYHGMDLGGTKLEGGKWEQLYEGDLPVGPGPHFSFTPGKTNFEYYSPQEMIDYFKEHEPNSQLILPGQ